MPSSTLLQLVARGRQDLYLTNNPQMTFFKHIYRRHTPFAIESIPIEFDGTPEFGRRISTLIPHNAELLGSLFLEIDLPALPNVSGTQYYWTNDIGHSIIQDVSIEIGDKEVDKHTGEWLYIWSELTVPSDKRDGFNNMVGHWNVYPDNPFSVGPLKLSIPLRFWFCNTIGAALPLIALQAHPVRIVMHLRPFQELWWCEDLIAPNPACSQITPVSPTRFQLFGDYYFLEKEERQRFAAVEHEYLIEQIQYTPVQSVPKNIASINIPLVFNHCCKEFFWVVRQDRMSKSHEWFNYSSVKAGEARIPDDLLDTTLLRLDGYDRFYRRAARYFRMTQPYQYHTVIPNNYIYLYSFSLRPESDQPSGSLNCSKIDDIIMNLTFNPALLSTDRSVVVYATNYNILRIVGGLGGLAFYA
jgi:hypothetical protein